MSRHCYVPTCPHGDYRLKRWAGVKCGQHGVWKGDPPCDCRPPFRLFPFPNKVRHAEKRSVWIKAIKRTDPENPHQFLEPTRYMVVCSRHFPDGEITEDHPYPELYLQSYRIARPSSKSESARSRKRRHDDRQKNKEGLISMTGILEENFAESRTPGNSDQFIILGLKFIIYILLSIIRRLKTSKHELENENDMLKKKLLSKQVRPLGLSSYVSQWMRTDTDCEFFTGIPTLSLFHQLHRRVLPSVKRTWRVGRSAAVQIGHFHRRPKTFGSHFSPRSVDEFLLTLMKIRLGLVNDDLAKRFNISPVLVHQIFHSWLTTMSKSFGKMVLWPSKEKVASSKPSCFAQFPNLRAIIESCEIFIERPKDTNIQNATYSNYKHHHTVKFLVVIAPNSTITFISPMYGGRSTDKEVTLGSGFLDRCERQDMILMDRGFGLQDEGVARHLTIHTPPGKRGQVAMTRLAVEKSKLVIGSLKTFKILGEQLPATLLPCVHKIVSVCAALYNLKTPMNSSSED